MYKIWYDATGLKSTKQGKKGAALMRYSDEVIEEVRARNDVVDVIGGYIHLQKKGSNYFGLCPFHNEEADVLLLWMWKRRKCYHVCHGL